MKNKPPKHLTDDDIRNFMKFLAINRKVAASTQNQAFNAILFFIGMCSERNQGI